VLEVKLSYTRDAWRQLENLYSPVVGRMWGMPVVGVQVCKGLAGRFGGPESEVVVVKSLRRGVALAQAGGRVVLHWAGLGPLEA
jgi:hypothetical protein